MKIPHVLTCGMVVAAACWTMAVPLGHTDQKELQCRSISITDDEGTPRITITADSSGGTLAFLGASGEQQMTLQIDRTPMGDTPETLMVGQPPTNNVVLEALGKKRGEMRLSSDGVQCSHDRVESWVRAADIGVRRGQNTALVSGGGVLVETEDSRAVIGDGMIAIKRGGKIVFSVPE